MPDRLAAVILTSTSAGNVREVAPVRLYADTQARTDLTP